MSNVVAGARAVNAGASPPRVRVDGCNNDDGPVHFGQALEIVMQAICWRRDSAEFQAKKARLRRRFGVKGGR